MAAMKYPRLFEPGMIGKMKVKNRIVFAPCATNFAAPFGQVTDRLIRYYAERAKGGVGLIIVENTKVKYPEGTIVSRHLRLDDDNYIPGYQELAEAVHAQGTKVFQQIQYPGRQTAVKDQAVAPSPIPCGFVRTPVRELTVAEIWDFVDKFSEATLRVKKAGMDGVEIQAGHGYLIAQFISPYTNKRTDEWGGSFERRMKFVLEIIKRTREKVGAGFPLGLRFSADEFVPGGITLEESKEIASIVEANGIDVLNVTVGIYESIPTLIEPMRYEEGWRVYLAEEIKKVVKIPVITVGQIKTPAFAERVLREEKADFVALGRPLIADPEWPKKAAEGREEDIRKCISCNIGCTGHVFTSRSMRCTVNPVVGREKEEGWLELKSGEKRKRVIVVGGGPAGMEAARVASLRGHEVTLYEKNSHLGGQLEIAAVSPGKDKINYIKEYYSRQLEKVGVEVELNKEVNEKLIQETKPDVVIIATGAETLMPDIPGILSRNVLSYHDVLSGKANVAGNKVIIAGGGMVGCETALYLADQGKKVTIVESLEELAVDTDPVTRFDILTQQLPKAGIQFLTKRAISEISDKGVSVSEPGGKRSFIEMDRVVIALGAKSAETLEEKINDIVPECYVIGDSKEPRYIIDAIYEGALVARLI